MRDVTTPASVDHVMALFKYPQPVSTSGSSKQDSSVAEVASEAHSVVCLVEETERGKPRSVYIKLSLEKKAEIGKYASKNGVANSVRHYKDLKLKESSVRDWRDAYLREVRLQKKTAKPGEEIIVAKLPSKKHGRPVLLGEKLDKHLCTNLLFVRDLTTKIIPMEFNTLTN